MAWAACAMADSGRVLFLVFVFVFMFIPRKLHVFSKKVPFVQHEHKNVHLCSFSSFSCSCSCSSTDRADFVQFTLNSSNFVVAKERTPPEVFFLRVRSPPSLWRRKVTWVRSFRTCERIEHKHEHEHEHEHEIRVGAQYVSHAARAKLPETNMNMNTNTRKRTGPQ